jgi:hypothetical protein
MKIPRIPSPDGISGKAWAGSDQGKGSTPRNVSNAFRDNYEQAFGSKPRGAGHTRIIYRDGKRIVIEN